jgi:Tripartite tricarboxylate transporter TctB family
VNGDTEPGLSMRSVEIVVATAIFALGAIVIYDSIRLGWRWGSDGPQAGYFPFYIGVILCACAVSVFARAWVDPRSQLFVSWTALKRVMQVLAPGAVFVLAIQVLGIYIAGAAYIGVFMRWLGRYSIALAALVGIAVMTSFFLMFEVWFKVPLYKGWLDPLGFLPY